MSAWRRYEILLPLKFNNGDPIPRQLIVDTLLELEERYAAVSCETQIIHGLWQHQGQRFRDDLMRTFVDVEDLPVHREFFRDYKEKLKARFQQVDIWMTASPIDVV